MKFQITSDCFLKNGDHAESGQVIAITPDEATALKLAGRGYPVPEDYQTPAEAAATAAAEAAAKAAEEAEAAAKAEAEAAALAAKAEPAKKK